MAIEISRVTTIHLTVEAEDGGKAEVVGAPQWAQSDTRVVAVQPSEDGFACALYPVSEGEAKVKAVAYIRGEHGDRKVEKEWPVIVQPGQSVKRTIRLAAQAGESQEQSPAQNRARGAGAKKQRGR